MILYHSSSDLAPIIELRSAAPERGPLRRRRNDLQGGALSSPRPDTERDYRSGHEVHEGRKQTGRRSAHAGSRLKLIDAPGRSRLIRLYLRPSRAAAAPTSATSSSIGRSATSSSSAAGRFGYPDRSLYSTAKWGLIGFTKTLAMELGEHNIRANAILPGAVDGDRIQPVFQGRSQANGQSVDEIKSIAMAIQSLKHLVDPDSIAALAVFLASDAGRSISGQVLPVDGDVQGSNSVAETCASEVSAQMFCVRQQRVRGDDVRSGTFRR
jgi:NAD(P)-dependent dehydrogenase (short-subunit alcohol dehydrogenase family)